MMKATVRFQESDGSKRQRTINVEKNEPNSIIRELAKVDKRIFPHTYITTIKCGRIEYQWFGTAKEAGLYL